MSNNNIPLNNVPINALAEITNIDRNFDNYKRLLELGFIVGSLIIPVHKSAFGNTVAYCIRGSVIALRYEDAANIFVEIKEV